MKLSLLSTFSGIGAFEKALDNQNIDYELVAYCEIDKYASKSYSAIHNVPESMNLGDITKVDVKTLPKDIDLFTFGFPCVPKGYKVKTNDGYKNIEDITVGDEVLTHNNRFERVVKTMNRMSDHINVIKGVGCHKLELTDEHPIYTLRNGEFCWVKARDITTSDCLLYNINQNSKDIDCTDDELWLLGRYCADGYREKTSPHRAIMCIGKEKQEEFEKHLNGTSNNKQHTERTCIEYRITSNHFTELLSGFGTGSARKEIPQRIIDLPKERLQIFLDGYLSGDGHCRKDREMTMFCTVSEKMFLALQEIVIKVYNVVPSVSIRVDDRKDSYKNSYNAQFSPKPKFQKMVGDKIAVPIKSIERIDTSIEVFNFEVENDNSYTVGNVIVHNCQDISLAGKQKGLFNEDGTKTRSGLFFDALRIIEETQPKVAIAENVKNLVGKKFKEQFKIVLDSLENAGYNNYWKVLNAKDYGIPQNRERVFVVSIRKDIDTGCYEFPEGFPLELRLKDMLEDEVDEKFYLSNKMTEKMVLQLEESGKHFVDIVGHCGTGGQKGVIHSTNGGIGALTATDYKQPKQIVVGDVLIGGMQKNQSVKTDGICTTLTSSMGTGGGYVPMIPIKTNNSKGYDVAEVGDYISIERPNSTTRRGRVGHGVSQCLDTHETHCVVTEPRIEVVGNYSPSGHDASRIVDENGLAPTVKENHGTVTAVATRGRLNEEGKYEQIIEMSDREYANAITTVQKDSLIAEPCIVEDFYKSRDARCYTDYAPSLRADRSGLKVAEPMAYDEQNGYIRQDGCVGTLTTDGSSPKHNNRVIVPHPIQVGSLEQEGYHEFSNRVYSPEGIERTLMGAGGNNNDKAGQYLMPNLRIRKLTPKECFRLQGFSDEDYQRTVDAKISASQQYKQAGNSICVPVVEHIIKALIDSGVYGGEAKVVEKEGQMEFTDTNSFYNYIKNCLGGNKEC